MSDDDGPRFPSAPPERIDLGVGVALVRARAHRAPAIVDAINTSLEHLRPWMAWAAEPATEAGMAAFCAATEQLWDERRDFSYTIVDPADTVVLGGCGLHGRAGRDSLEIGYWVHVDHGGRGIATALTRALTDAAFAIHGIDVVRITCEDTNARSARVPEKLGYGLVGVSVPEGGPCAGRSSQEWVVSRARWMTSRPLASP
jgi:RimJ/RimL family protein N-acetyltransferase